MLKLAEEYLDIAVEAAGGGGQDLAESLDRLPVAIYLTDTTGTITHFNRACITLAGRTPTVRHDKWCVTWKLYTLDGARLPHDECPMAVAIRERRKVRGAEAVAERPDGTRVRFVPYPTPLFEADGTFVGAVNLLVDVTQIRHSEYLRDRQRIAAGSPLRSTTHAPSPRSKGWRRNMRDRPGSRGTQTRRRT